MFQEDQRCSHLCVVDMVGSWGTVSVSDWFVLSGLSEDSLPLVSSHLVTGHSSGCAGSQWYQLSLQSYHLHQPHQSHGHQEL